MIVSDDGDEVVADLICMLKDCCVEAPAASETPTAKDEVPVCDGVPEIAPEEAESVSPSGSVPDLMLHEYGAVPPDAERVVW